MSDDALDTLAEGLAYLNGDVVNYAAEREAGWGSGALDKYRGSAEVLQERLRLQGWKLIPTP